VSPAEFFSDRPEAGEIFDAIHAAVRALGPASVRVSKSQVGFRRRRPFAAAWVPGRYLHGEHAPLVLTLFLPRRVASRRFKEVVEPSPGRFTHHLELSGVEDVDGEVHRLLKLAWDEAE
jgi:hypothetical protein